MALKTELVSETLELMNHLTRLSARGNFNGFCVKLQLMGSVAVKTTRDTSVLTGWFVNAEGLCTIQH